MSKNSTLPSVSQLLDDASAFFRGDGVEASIENGIKCLELAAQQDCDEAHFRLGALYSNGRVMKLDLDKALFHFMAAADKGHIMGAFGTGSILLKKQEFKEARALFETLAEQGLVAAQMNLSQLCLLGKGGDVDLQAAEEWLTKAADSGEPMACFQLALMYHKGDELEKNESLARQYAESAVKGNLSEAIPLLAGLMKEQAQSDDDKIQALALYYRAQEEGVAELDLVIEQLEAELPADAPFMARQTAQQ